MKMFKIVFGVLIIMLLGVIEAYAIEQSICDSGSKVTFYPNGSLESCVLKDDFRSNEIKCSMHRAISFYDDGALKTCILAEPAAVNGQKCKQFDPINFYPDGKFRSCTKTD